MRIADLTRNDTQGAIRVYKARLDSGTLYPGAVRVLLMLQDDPTELLAAMKTENPKASTATWRAAGEGYAETRTDAGYNPYRSGEGKFAPGPHHSAHQAPRAPDAYHGRFAAGHGAAHDESRVARVRSDAMAIAKASGHADHAARGEHEAAKERETIANEHRVVAVGHVAPVPTAKLAAYDTVHASVQERAARAKATLDEHQGEAARALATLHAHPEHGDGHDPTDEHEQASTQIGHVAGHVGETSYAHEPAAPTGMYREHAAAAQTALEVLHGHQTRAAAELKQADREHERAAAAMQREAELHADRGVRLADGHPEHAAASAAAESMSAHEADRRGDIASEMRTRIEDAHAALREATRGTARAVRELAAITGRAPQLAGK